MITYKQLKDFCNKCNVRFELNKRLWDVNDSAEDPDNIRSYYFGMNSISGRSGKSEWQWFWFESIGKEINDDTLFFFVERYSMVNGSSNTNWREGIKAEDCIERRMKAA